MGWGDESSAPRRTRARIPSPRPHLPRSEPPPGRRRGHGPTFPSRSTTARPSPTSAWPPITQLPRTCRPQSAPPRPPRGTHSRGPHLRRPSQSRGAGGAEGPLHHPLAPAPRPRPRPLGPVDPALENPHPATPSRGSEPLPTRTRTALEDREQRGRGGSSRVLKERPWVSAPLLGPCRLNTDAALAR